MANKKYYIELVIKEPPYITLGFLKNTSISNNKLEYTNSKKDALIAENKETFVKVFNLIAENNKNKNKVNVMDWITEVDTKKRVFLREICWD